MGEDVSDMATTTSQLQAKLLALTGGKVDIMLDENTFKSSTQILREMAAAWEDMSDLSRASALELMGGKRQANVLSALITNFDTAEKAIEASANSAGSALRENEVYLDSIQGRIDLLTNATQTMWKNALNSDLVKWFVNLLTTIVQIVDKLGLFRTVLAGIIMYMTKKHGINLAQLFFGPKDINVIIKGLGKIKNSLMQIRDIWKGTKQTEQLALPAGQDQKLLPAAKEQKLLQPMSLVPIEDERGLIQINTQLTELKEKSDEVFDSNKPKGFFDTLFNKAQSVFRSLASLLGKFKSALGNFFTFIQSKVKSRQRASKVSTSFNKIKTQAAMSAAKDQKLLQPTSPVAEEVAGMLQLQPKPINWEEAVGDPKPQMSKIQTFVNGVKAAFKRLGDFISAPFKSLAKFINNNLVKLIAKIKREPYSEDASGFMHRWERVNGSYSEGAAVIQDVDYTSTDDHQSTGAANNLRGLSSAQGKQLLLQSASLVAAETSDAIQLQPNPIDWEEAIGDPQPQMSRIQKFINGIQNAFKNLGSAIAAPFKSFAKFINNSFVKTIAKFKKEAYFDDGSGFLRRSKNVKNAHPDGLSGIIDVDFDDTGKQKAIKAKTASLQPTALVPYEEVDDKNKKSGVTSAVSKQFTNIKTTASKAFNSVKDVANKAATSVQNVFNKATASIKNAFSGIASAAKNVTNSIKTAFSKVGTTIESTFTTAFNKVKGSIGNIAKSVSNTFKNIAASINNVVVKSASKLTGDAYYDDGSGFLKRAKQAKADAGSYTTGLSEIIDVEDADDIGSQNTGIAKQNKASGASSAISKQLANMKSDASKTFNSVRDTANKAAWTIHSVFDKITLSVKNSFDGIAGAAKSAASSVKTAFGKVGETIGATFASAFTKVKGSLGTIAKSVSNTFKKIALNINNTLVKTISKLTKDAYYDEGDGRLKRAKKVGNTTASASDYGTTGSSEIIYGQDASLLSSSGIIPVNTIASESDKASGHINKIKAAINGVSSAFAGITKPAQETFSGIADTAKAAANNIKRAFSKVSSNIKTTLGKIGAIGGKAFNSIKTASTKVAAGVKKAFDNVKQILAKTFKSITKVAGAAFTKIKEGAASTGKSFAQGLGYGAKKPQTSGVTGADWMNAGVSKDTPLLFDGNDVAAKIDLINQKTVEGNAALNTYMNSLGSSDNALKAYVGTLNGGQASLAGFNGFLKMQATAQQQAGISGFFASVGVQALNAALSMGISFLIQFVMQGLMKLIDFIKDLINPTQKLEEELSDLNSEISDIQSEIDSMNDELETTQERIAELLALPHLSFTEQEEIKNLQAQADELERITKLKQTALEDKEVTRIETAEKLIDTSWNDQGDWYIDGDGVIQEDSGWNGFWNNSKETKDILDKTLLQYASRYNAEQIYNDAKKELEENGELSSDTFAKIMIGNPEKTADTIKKAEKFRNKSSRASDEDLLNDYYEDVVSSDKTNKTTEKMGDSIRTVLDKHVQYIVDNDLSYGMSDKIDAYLDEIYAYEYKFQEAQGIDSTSSAIASIFDDTASTSIKGLKESLSEIASDDTLDDSQKQTKALELVNEALESTDKGYQRLKTSMDIIGITADEVARYFVQLSGAPDSSTVEGITAQYQKGVDALGKYKDNAEAVIAEFTALDGTVENITWGDLFDDEGEVIDTQISKVLQGADETARKEFSRIVKMINDGKMEVETAMQSFGISGTLAGFKLIEESLVDLNTDVFKALGDDISGLIDTFEELGAVLESVAGSMDLVSHAEAEQAYSGSVSLETALKLMQTTDDWNKVLTITEGNITLNENATENLVKDQLNLVVANLKTSLSTVSAQIAQNNMAASSENLGKTLEESTTESVRQLAANMEYLGSLVSDFLSFNWIGMNDRAKNAKAASLESTKVSETQETETDWETQQTNLVAQLNMMGITATIDENGNVTYDGEVDWEKIMGGYSSDDASGGNGTVEDVIKSGWEKLINEYENKLALITNERDLIESEIDKMESQGGKAAAQYYKDLIHNTNEEKTLLEDNYDKLKLYMDLHKDEVDAETWTDWNNTLNEMAVSIKECTTNILGFYDALEELTTHYFEQSTDDVSRLGEEIEFVQGLLEDEDVADKDGNWTDAGYTMLGLYTNEMERAAAAAAMYDAEIDKVGASWADYQKLLENATDINGDGIVDAADISEDALNGLYDTYGYVITSEEEYKEKTDELTDSMHSEIDAFNSAKDGIVELNEARIDAIKEGIEKEIEAYEDYIDVVKDALDAERDLYDFKKNIQKQTKDIASLERRIASLSGSTNASDVAERKRLQAELNNSREELNDTYYDHAKDQQSQALDDEAEAFRESKEKYIEELEATLDDVETIVTNSIMEVMLNADTVLAQLNEISNKYGIDLSAELTKPWVDAAAKPTEYWKNAKDAMSGYADFLTSSELGTNFEKTITGFGTQIQSLVTHWNDVRDAANNAYAAQNRTTTVGGNPNTGDDSGDDKGVIYDPSDGVSMPAADVKKLQYVLNNVFGEELSLDGSYGPATTAAVKRAQGTIGASQDGYYGPDTRTKMDNYIRTKWQANNGSSSAIGQGIQQMLSKLPYTYYAKGTTGTKKSGFAITDESWIGEEITLAAGKNGQLQYLKKGSAVMPADISENLIEWGKINPNTLNVGGGANINMISNAVSKPEFNLSFEALVKADKIDENTLPEVKKFVQQEINNLVKQMNYALRGKGAR